MYQYFQDKTHEQQKEELKNRLFKTNTIIKTIPVCPQCEKPMRSRETKQPKYRCYRCNLNTDQPIQKFTLSTLKQLNKQFFKEWIATHKEEIDTQFNPTKEKKDQEYLNFNNVMILCNKCHMALHRGMHLCPTCKKHYAKNRFTQWAKMQTRSALIYIAFLLKSQRKLL